MSVVCCAPKGNARRPLDSILYCLVNCKWLWAATAPCRTDWYRKSCAPQPKNFSATHMNYIIKFAPFHKYIYIHTYSCCLTRIWIYSEWKTYLINIFFSYYFLPLHLFILSITACAHKHVFQPIAKIPALPFLFCCCCYILKTYV